MALEIAQCKNGHFFDVGKYQSCPHCGAAVDPNYVKKEKTFSKGEYGKKSGTGPSGWKKKTVSQEGEFQNEGLPERKTEMLMDENDSRRIDPGTEVILEEQEFTARSVSSVLVEASPVVQENNSYSQPSNVQNSMQSVPLYADDIGNSNDNVGKTVGIFRSASNASTEPVVGWLICVKGCHFGECFAIYAGNNSIGRGNSNRIVLGKDNTVSGTKHAWITYEPKRREFYIMPGESSGLTYLNDDIIMSSQKIKSYDQVELGAGKYVFLALCGEQFTWEDYLE